MKWHSRKDRDDFPTSGEGWYRVMVRGDSESVDGHTIYDYPDYETWAYWTPATSEEYEDYPGGWKGGFVAVHDEEMDSIFAFVGPFTIPPYE